MIVYVSPDGRARRVGRRLDLPGGRRPGDGAADEHRLVHADRRRRREHPERPAPQGDQRRGRLAPGPGAEPRPQRRSGRPTRCARRRTSPRTRRCSGTSSTSSPPRCPRCCRRSTATRRCRRASCSTSAARRSPLRTCRLWQRILNTLIDPNLISLMLSLGVLGIVFELFHPGLIFPATFGVLCLALAFFGLDVLPINWAGLVLIFAAFAFWITELFIAFSHGALTVAGAACFVFGSLLLFQPAGAATTSRCRSCSASRWRSRCSSRWCSRRRCSSGDDRRRSGRTCSSARTARCGRTGSSRPGRALAGAPRRRRLARARRGGRRGRDRRADPQRPPVSRFRAGLGSSYPSRRRVP